MKYVDITRCLNWLLKHRLDIFAQGIDASLHLQLRHTRPRHQLCSVGHGLGDGFADVVVAGDLAAHLHGIKGQLKSSGAASEVPKSLALREPN